jgi:hypothetical protein
MYDIDELERQWERYVRKRLMKRVGLGVAGAAIVIGLILWATFKGASADEEQNGKVGDTTVSERNVSVSQREQSSPLQPESPSVSASRSKKPKITIRLSDQEEAENDQSTETEAERKIRLEMTDIKNAQVVKEIENRFSTTRDYDDAIYLAKYYYGKKSYRKAEYWAMQANGIDSGKEESWLVFGKAKAKQGRRADALRVLQAYYDRSGSMRAKELIDRIRKGKPY